MALDLVSLQTQSITANTTITVGGPAGLGVDLVIITSATASQLTTGVTLYAAVGNYAGNIQSRLTNPGQPGSGGRLRIRNDSAFPQPITPAGSDVLQGGNLVPPNSTVELYCDGQSNWYVEGPFSQTGAVGGLITQQVTLNTAAVTGMFAAPVAIIPAPAAGVVIRPIDFELSTTVSTQFGGGGATILQYANTVNGAGTNSLTTTVAAAIINAAAAQFAALKGADLTGAAASGFTGIGLFMSNATGAFTGGAGSSVKITVAYRLITI